LILLGWEAPFKTAERTVWLNPRFRNAGFLVGRTQPETWPAETAAIDFRQTAMVAPGTPTLADSSDPPAGEASRMPARNLTVWILRSPRSQALLVIPGNYYPGWSAMVNGKPTPIHRTNWIGMGVNVPAGNSLVTLRFVSPGSKLGIWLSCVSVVSWLLLLLAVTRTASRKAYRTKQSDFSQTFR